MLMIASILSSTSFWVNPKSILAFLHTLLSGEIIPALQLTSKIFYNAPYFVAETKGTMDSLNLRPIEQAKIACAKRLFNAISTSQVRYHDVDSHQSLLDIMENL